MSNNFQYLDDPGVKIRYRKGVEDLGVPIDKLLKEDTSKNDAFVEKWGFIFEKLWYMGHIFVMTTSILSILLCITRQVLKPWPRLLYRCTFAGAVITYGLSLFQNLNGAQPGFYALLPLPTFQYIMLATLWIFTTPHTIKLIPYALFSLLHVADTASEHHSESKRRANIAHGLSDHFAPKVLDIMGYLDMWLIVELTRDCLVIRPGAVVSFIIFTFFYRVRLMTSPTTMKSFMHCYNYADKFLTRDQTPKQIRNLWIRLRNKIQVSRLKSSDLHREDTEKAIEWTNLWETFKA